MASLKIITRSSFLSSLFPKKLFSVVSRILFHSTIKFQNNVRRSVEWNWEFYSTPHQCFYSVQGHPLGQSNASTLPLFSAAPTTNRFSASQRADSFRPPVRERRVLDHQSEIKEFYITLPQVFSGGEWSRTLNFTLLKSTPETTVTTTVNNSSNLAAPWKPLKKE